LHARLRKKKDGQKKSFSGGGGGGKISTALNLFSSSIINEGEKKGSVVCRGFKKKERERKKKRGDNGHVLYLYLMPRGGGERGKLLKIEMSWKRGRALLNDAINSSSGGERQAENLGGMGKRGRSSPAFPSASC